MPGREHSGQRLSVQPLLRLVGDNQVALSKVAGVHHRQVRRWMQTGVPWVIADRLAVRLGHHPAELWDEWCEVLVGNP